MRDPPISQLSEGGNLQVFSPHYPLSTHSLPMVSISECTSSDDDSSFELIDTNALPIEKLSLNENELTEPIKITVDSAESTELKLLRETINAKDEEIDRLIQENVAMREAIETGKWRARLLDRLYTQRREIMEAEERSVNHVIELKKRMMEEKVNELNKLHRVEIREMDVEIVRLSQLNEGMRTELEDIKEKLIELLKGHESKTSELTKLQAEVKEKDSAIGRLSLLIEVQCRKIEELSKSLDHSAHTTLRTISFRKVDGQFGAGHNGTMITVIEKGGPADLAGLRRGDQLISINGINVETLSNDQITMLSEDVDDDVTLIVRFNPERLADLWMQA